MRTNVIDVVSYKMELCLTNVCANGREQRLSFRDAEGHVWVLYVTQKSHLWGCISPCDTLNVYDCEFVHNVTKRKMYVNRMLWCCKARLVW